MSNSRKIRAQFFEKGTARALKHRDFRVTVNFALSIVGYLAFTYGLMVINPHNDKHQTKKSSGLIADVMEGVRYIAKHSSIGPVLLSDFMGASFSRPVMDLAPGFADDVFNRGAEGFGLLLSAIGIGGIFGAIGALICLITVTVMSPKRKQLAAEMERDSTAATIAEAKTA